MNKVSIVIILFISLLGSTNCNNQSKQAGQKNYIVSKENGKIIKAYLAFEDFLNTDRSWDNYKKIVLDPFPEMQAVHKTQLSWGSIDSVSFPEEVSRYKKEDWVKYFNQYNDETLDFLSDSIIRKANTILRPVTDKPVDLCLFLPYGGCFILTGKEKSTIYISLLIDPKDVQKIMIHEYAHNLYMQRHGEEPFTLKREIVSEGLAVYFTTLYLKSTELSRSIPFMTEASVKWCFENEMLIKNAIRAELNDTTFACLKKFIADGSVATPPEGFVEKTGFFAGFRIIEACIKKGMKLEDICSLKSDSVISKSNYFN